jgi:hypothetical protein
MRRTIGFFSFLAIILCVLPVATHAIDFGGISARPANPQAGDERTAAWFVYTLSPGSSSDDAIVIENNTDQEKVFELYPADSTPSTGGGFALKQKAEPMTSLGGWVNLKKNSVTLAPHEKISIPFRLSLPANLAPGLYAGGIIVAENAGQKEQNGININTRIGVRMYVTAVGPAGGLPRYEPSPYLIMASALLVLLLITSVYMFIVFKRKKKHGSRLR